MLVLNRTVLVNGHVYPYAVYVPPDFDAQRAWPVILALHGAGERGTDGVRQMQIGIASAIRAHPERVPAIVVFPQAPEDTCWLGEPADAAMAALDQAMREFHGDPERVYATGLSMGGYGTIHLALAHPRHFAALVIVCGGLFAHATTNAVRQSPLVTSYAQVAKALRATPVWLFHGADDDVIPVDESRALFAALRAEGAPVRYTEYAGVGHAAWTRAYDEAALWEWLFARRAAIR